MEHFLKIIASGYNNKYRDISRLTFVMPNKRSGTFLLKNFKELQKTPVFSPRIIPITEFIDNTIETVKDSRMDLLFRLFESYRRISKKTDMEFEKFSSWGETMLSDFNEVDMHMKDADEIFRNVSDLNSIRSTFLSEEQKKVMVEYFGYSPEKVLEEAVRFWEEFEVTDSTGEEEKSLKASRKKFYTLWQLLPLIYRDFKARLKADGLTTEGGGYREAAERIESGFEPFKGDKIIFVGFNALAESERRIFKALKKMKVEIDGEQEPKADYIWDILPAEETGNMDAAMKFVKINSRKDNFPAPEWIESRLEHNTADWHPEIEVIAVPSNMMQVKVAAQILDRWKDIQEENPGEEGERMPDSEIAVVLPDENLLLPLLHSLPSKYHNPNLTMGFPLKHTSVISYASLLRKLHIHSRQTEEGAAFLYEDVKDLLSHPYSRVLFQGKDISEFVKETENSKRVTVTTGMLDKLGKNAGVLFRHFSEEAPTSVVIDYLKRLFSEIKDRLYESATFLNSNVEKVYISVYIDALVRLSNCLSDYDVRIKPAGIFTLADRLMAGEKVTLEGEPLSGLQVMGMLETRCLDFKKVVMLSVNEKIIPRVGRNATFIPNVIRGAYGMPPANYQEELFAYYFFRLMGRCQEGLLTYDSRSSESRTPGASRYLLQMKYLPGGFKYNETEARFGMPVRNVQTLSVQKDDFLNGRLSRYLYGKDRKIKSDEEPKNFSASSLGKYMKCPLQFLYQGVLELYVDQEKIETIDAIDLGTIIHSTIENLYIPNESDRGKILEKPIVLTKDHLKGILNRKLADGSGYIAEVAKREIIKTHFHVKESEVEKEKLRGSSVFLLDYIVEYVKNIIRQDIEMAPFRLWGTEIKETVDYPLSDGRKVNIKMVIDRLDQYGDEGADEPFRIIDYKTGTVHLEAPTFRDVFNGNYSAQNIFQLLLYAELLIYIVKEEKIKLSQGIDLDKFYRNLEIGIYSILKLPGKDGFMVPKIEDKKIKNMGDLREFEESAEITFREALDSLLLTILDPQEAFEGEMSERKCAWCDYRLRCEVLAAR